MCGIAGILGSKLDREQLINGLQGMKRCLQHRGPDDDGMFIAEALGTGLVHTRLSILDLSPAGHQPMASADGRYHIVYNGEVYNFEALRADLIRQGEQLVSHSDTEVILAMYRRYGIDCVREFEGMFALAIYDQRDGSCFFARGPLGVKPLYYYKQNGSFVFASEVRTLLASGLVPRRLSPSALHGYLLFGAVPEPETLLDNVVALPPGCYLTWRNASTQQGKYWQLHFDPEPFTAASAIQTVRSALDASVDRHLVSDVPVGVFLSGGIDSTALVALASQRQKTRVQTFSISFEDARFDEGGIARRTADHFGTDHFDWKLDAGSARSLLNRFLNDSDQPSIDGFNTYCVSKHAHDQGLKVVLSGLGGDELFGGYTSFQRVPAMVQWSRNFNALAPLRRGAGSLLQRYGNTPRIRKLGSYFEQRPTSAAAYWSVRGVFTVDEATSLVRKYCGADSLFNPAAALIPVPPQPTYADEVSYLEVTRYMRNQLLRDSDVLSMAWGLELRVPFVDASFVDAIARIPAKLRLAPGKQLLVAAVPEIPEWVKNRPKQGFVFPFESWISGEWKDLFSRLESESPVRLQNWYRRWCLLALESFLVRNDISASPLSAAA